MTSGLDTYAAGFNSILLHAGERGREMLATALETCTDFAEASYARHSHFLKDTYVYELLMKVFADDRLRIARGGAARSLVNEPIRRVANSIYGILVGPLTKGSVPAPS